MEISVLASGSKGNCSYIGTDSTKLLVDAGISCIQIQKKLAELEISPNEIDGMIITHTHADHINGLRVFLKKFHTKLYVTKKMYDELVEQMNIENYELINKSFSINDVEITTIKTSHDVSDSNGYIFESRGKSIVYITDTGYINVKNHNLLENKDLYVMESNHDIQMLMDGKYPYHLKQRILGDKGHLSNDDSAKYLSKFIGTKTKKIILIHLSQDNNTEQLARKSLEKALLKREKHVGSIIVSKQNERTELIKI